MTESNIAPVADEGIAEEREPTSEPSLDEMLVEDDLVVEEVSIDGMCGVY